MSINFSDKASVGRLSKPTFTKLQSYTHISGCLKGYFNAQSYLGYGVMNVGLESRPTQVIYFAKIFNFLIPNSR